MKCTFNYKTRDSKHRAISLDEARSTCLTELAKINNVTNLNGDPESISEQHSDPDRYCFEIDIENIIPMIDIIELQLTFATFYINP